ARGRTVDLRGRRSRPLRTAPTRTGPAPLRAWRTPSRRRCRSAATAESVPTARSQKRPAAAAAATQTVGTATAALAAEAVEAAPARRKAARWLASGRAAAPPVA